jgi:ribosomal protein L37AE/L43A
MNLKGLPCPECGAYTMEHSSTPNIYQCKTCGKTYTREEFEELLNKMR